MLWHVNLCQGSILMAATFDKRLVAHIVAVLDAGCILKAHLREHDGVLSWGIIRFQIFGGKWVSNFMVINLGGFFILVLSGTSRIVGGLNLILHK